MSNESIKQKNKLKNREEIYESIVFEITKNKYHDIFKLLDEIMLTKIKPRKKRF